ncbi:MAG: hypothetical protein HY763_11945 [Planctomycetes bacterium]|nr:hypothetical protein [Planctomycetota bacterium]
MRSIKRRIRPFTGLALVLGLCLFAAPALAQPDASSPLAVVTALTGTGANRTPPRPEEPSTGVGWGTDLRSGEHLITSADGTAVITLSEWDTVVHVSAASDVSLELLASAPAAQVPVAVTVHQGEAAVLRRPSDNRWILVAGGKGAGAGYTLSQRASLLVRADAKAATFTAAAGDAACFAGSPPAAPLVSDAGQLKDQRGTVLLEGQRISTEGLGQPAPDHESGARAASRLGSELYAFALTCGKNWVREAEQGDFTPVRGEARAAPEILRTETSPEPSFDQPRSVVAAPAPRVVTQRQRVAAVNQARQLIETGIPASVVVGQRLRRTRIVGNPGTSGGVRVNPNVEQLIQLAR